MIRPRAICLAASLLASQATAQDIVGQAFLNDRPVTLFDDGTWAFDTSTLNEGCQIVDQFVQFCDTDGLWHRSTGPSYGFDAIFRNTLENTLQAAIVAHPYGSRVGNSPDGVMAQFIKGAAELDGIPEDTVVLLNRSETLLDDRPARHFVIAFPQNKLWQVNAYTVTVDDDVSVYALTWAAGDSFTENMQSAHKHFVQAVSITGGKTSP